MSGFRPVTPEQRAELRGPEGDLVFVRLSVAARSLEDVLDALSRASFPVNPEIRHGSSTSTVEFPAYDRHVEEVRNILLASGLAACGFEVSSALAAIQ